MIERVAYRPLRKRNAPPLAFLITAIGASIAISEAFGICTRRRPEGAPSLISREAGVPPLRRADRRGAAADPRCSRW